MTPMTPTTPAISAKGSHKIRENQFSPDTIRLTRSSKSLLRQRVALGEVFEGVKVDTRDKFLWDVIHAASIAGDSSPGGVSLADVFDEVKGNSLKKELLPGCVSNSFYLCGYSVLNFIHFRSGWHEALC
jgi:hypothetical protein